MTVTFDMANRMGRIPHLDRFDAEFFGCGPQDETSAEARMLLETTYEAIIDSGINP